MAIERTFNLVKPGGVQRGIAGRVIARFEDKGLRLVGMKLCKASRELAEANYADQKDEPWFDDLINYITSGPIIAMVWEGENAIEAGRQLVGNKDPLKSESGSIRGLYNVSKSRNVVHGARTPEEAQTEIALWFGDGGAKSTWDLLEPVNAPTDTETDSFPRAIEPTE